MIGKDLYPTSIKFIYDGMIVPYDIYDYTATHLLVRKGKELRESQINSIKRINNGKDIIYVNEVAMKMMMNHQLEDKIQSRVKIEKETGYDKVKNETMAILDNIEQSDAISQEEIFNVSGKLSNQLDATKSDVILDLINALAPVDEYLQRHCMNVSYLNGLFGKWIGLPKETVNSLILIGLLHDCGKAFIPRKILSAPRPLTLVEFEVIKMHTVHSDNILNEFNEQVRKSVRFHHEKYNGLGYPDSINSANIPTLARITAISDIYDAMTSRRSYKDPQSPFFVLSFLNELRDTELDPKLTELFLNYMPKELVDKPVMLSDGSIGIIQRVDPDDYKHPYVIANGREIKCSEDLYCRYMYHE